MFLDWISVGFGFTLGVACALVFIGVISWVVMVIAERVSL